MLAENEDVLAKIGWEPNSVEMGFDAGDNTVTVARYTGGGSLFRLRLDARRVLPYIADSVQRFNNWQITFTTSHGMGSLRPLIVISPIIAEQLAKAGWSKLDVKRFIYEHARRPAYDFERQLRVWNIRGVWDWCATDEAGRIPLLYESDDPNRLVPIVWKPGGLHGRRDRRSAAQQRARVRAEWLPRLSDGQEDRAAKELELLRATRSEFGLLHDLGPASHVACDAVAKNAETCPPMTSSLRVTAGVIACPAGTIRIVWPSAGAPAASWSR